MNKLLALLLVLSLASLSCSTRVTKPVADSAGETITAFRSDYPIQPVKQGASPAPSEEEDPPPPPEGGDPPWTMALTGPHVHYAGGPPGWYSQKRIGVRLAGPWLTEKDTLEVMVRWESIYGGIGSTVSLQTPALWTAGSILQGPTDAFNYTEFRYWWDSGDSSGYMGIKLAGKHANVPDGDGNFLYLNFGQRYGSTGSGLVKVTLVAGSWLLNGAPNGWHWAFSPRAVSNTQPLPTCFGVRDTMTYSPEPDGSQ